MAEPQMEVLSYEQWLAQNGHNFDKLSGMPGWTPEAIDSLKKDQYNRYKMHKGASLPDDAYQYGGQAGGANAASQQYGGYADRSLEQQDKFYGQQEQQYANAMDDRGRALDARGAQNRVADLMWNRASGRVPSIAQMQADRQMGQLAAEQTSQAASARGPAALALAQQNQANATATGQSAISGQAQINAAMERERAEQAAFGAYSGIRQGDYQGQQLSQQGQGIALQGAGQAGQQALGYSGLQHSVNTAQLQARGNKQAQESADKWAQASKDAANRARQDAKEAGYMGAAATGGIGLAGVAAQHSNDKGSSDKDDLTSDERAKVPVGRSPGIAPQEPYANPSTYEQSRQAAARALDAEEQREAKARAYGTPQSLGPATHGGVSALDRYEQDQVDTLQAKQRHGVPLDAKEKRMAEAMKRGQKYGDKRGPADQPTAPTQPVGTEPVKHTDHKKEEPKQESPSLLSQGLGVAKDVSKDLFARPVAPPNYNFYTAPQQQQITSDMGAKRRIGLNDFMSDMGTKLPYSDERAKTGVSFGFGDHDGGAKSGVSPSRREAMEEETDANAKWAGLMKNAPGIPTKEGPDAGYGHMFSDMGTKRAPMVSDDRAKLAKAWDQGHAAAIANVEKMSRLPADELKQRAELRQGQTADDESTASASTARGIKARAWDEGSSDAKALYTAKGRNEAMNAMYEAEKRKAQVEGHRLVPNNAGGRLSGIAARFRRPGTPEYDQANATRDAIDSAQSATVRAAKREQSLDPLQSKGEQLMHGIEDQGLKGMARANVVSDERAKKASAWADAEMAKVKSEDERMSKRPPAVGSQHVSDEAMAQAARSMEASPYAYKPEFKPEEQAPGEVNVGPMAQKMEKSPIAATAVRKDPQTGLRSLDRDKLIKVQGGILASQQKQIDDLKAAQLSREADRQIQNYRADRPAATNARQDALMRQADEQIQNYRTERPASVIDRDRPASPPSWLSKYMEGERYPRLAEQDPEEEKGTTRRSGRLALNDLISARRRKA